MLFLPLLDKQWSLQKANSELNINVWRGISLLLFASLAAVNQDMLTFSLITLILVALPEEWFFRAYLMGRIREKLKFAALQSNLGSNALTAAFFSLMHLPAQGITGLLVFFPALIYGWVYQKTRDLLLVILLHAISNQFFMLFLKDSWYTILDR